MCLSHPPGKGEQLKSTALPAPAKEAELALLPLEKSRTNTAERHRLSCKGGPSSGAVKMGCHLPPKW